MAPVQREIKFQEILRELLEQQKATVTQKKLASALNVSSTTVSHYITGRISPSFSALVGIAQFFNVTLDYLVFGERAPQKPADDTASAMRSDVFRALAEANTYNGRQRDLVARVSRHLYDRIDEVAKTMLDDPENFGPAGFFTDAEALAIESCAKRTKVLLRTAPADIVADGDRPGQGVFFNTLVENITAGRDYQFLFYGKRAAFAPFSRMYRELLDEAKVSPDAVNSGMGFRVIDSELPAGIVIHELDLASLERREPILYERFSDGIVDGIFAYVSIRHRDALGGMVLYGTYLDSALKLFKRDWELATVI